MQIEEVVVAAGASVSSKEWQFALKNMYVNCPIDVRNLNCFKSMACVFSKGTIVGQSIIKDTPGYIIGTDSGILVLCPRENDFPVTEWAPKKEIRVVEVESKFFKHYVCVKTNDMTYTFKTDKANIKDLEKLVNKVRL